MKRKGPGLSFYLLRKGKSRAFMGSCFAKLPGTGHCTGGRDVAYLQVTDRNRGAGSQ